jgi:hypothetical protein
MRRCDPIERAFDQLRQRVVASTTVPSAEKIIRSGQLRRIARRAVAGTAMVSIAIGIGIWAVGQLQQGAVTPAGPDTSPVPSGTRDDLSSTFPLGFLLHEDEGERADGFARGPCYGQPLASAGVARDFDATPGRGTVYQELFLYPDEVAARRVFETLQADLPGCVGYPHAEPLMEEQLAWTDEVTAATVRHPRDGAGDLAGRPLRFVALRVGTVVAVFHGGPDEAEVDRDAMSIVPRLCLYDPACVPLPGLPEPVGSLHDGLQVWAAVLVTFDPSDTAARSGVAAAAAAELGYRPQVVSTVCDEDLRPGSTSPDISLHSVVLYFSERTLAQELADALPDFAVQVIPVRTYCL